MIAMRRQKRHLTQARKPSPKLKPNLTFSDHIGELRKRLMWVGLFFGIGSMLAYHYKDALLRLVMAPLHGEKLMYLTPAGGFSFIFQVTMYAGMLLAVPVLIYQLHAFIKPALPEQARKSAVKIVLA